MNDRLVQSQIEELERKLRAYERLIETLPFPFTFADYESGIAIEKKLAVAGRIAAGIAHEIRNPLTTVRGYLQLLKTELPDRIASLVERLLIPELDRANGIITDFLNIAKPADVKMETFRLHRFLRDDVGVLL